MTLSLTLTAVVTGSLLAFVNEKTAGPIRQQNEKILSDGIRFVMGTEDIVVGSPVSVTQSFDGKEYTFAIHPVLTKTDTPLGAAVESVTQGFGGNLKVLVGFDTKGVVTGYTLLEHAETPGLGAKADTWFQEGQKGNIIGRQAGSLVVSKDGGEVDAITASTITSRAFLKAVNQAYQAYKHSDTDADTGASTKNR